MEQDTKNNVSATNELVPVSEGKVGGVTCNVCDARALHTFLGARKDFTNWIKDRIARYQFLENQDFTIYSPNLASKPSDCSPNLASKRGGHNRTNYLLTLDMAKELAMVENNEKGRQARRYFIECEKKARGATSGIQQPQLGNAALPYDVEKACDFAAIRLSNELHHQAMALMGGTLHDGDEELVFHCTFLLKRRVQDRLVSFAKDRLSKNVSPEKVVEAVMSWRPLGLSGLAH